MPPPSISLIQVNANANSLHTAIALSEESWLREVITTLAYDPASTKAEYLKQLPEPLNQILYKELGRRTWTLPNTGKVRSYPWKELVRVGLIRSKLDRALNIDRSQTLSWVQASLDKRTAHYHLDGLRAIYGYEDGCATTFAQAKQQGICCLYDLPIPFYQLSRSIQLEEAERFPELAASVQAIKEPAWKLERKEQEIALSDHIFVASSMTQRSLLEVGVSAEKISIIPYGAPTEYFQPQLKQDSIFRALYVGRMSPRKGVQYLLSAWKALNLPNAELLFVGSNMLPENWISPYQYYYKHVASVPHASLNKYYSSANVLVFPSLVEGFGLVLTEAMACGIPVITTPNTAGPDIITDGIEGFIVPIRDEAALQEKIEWCYQNPEALAEMGRAARLKAEQLSWQTYRYQLNQTVHQLLGTSFSVEVA